MLMASVSSRFMMNPFFTRSLQSYEPSLPSFINYRNDLIERITEEIEKTRQEMDPEIEESELEEEMELGLDSEMELESEEDRKQYNQIDQQSFLTFQSCTIFTDYFCTDKSTNRNAIQERQNVKNKKQNQRRSPQTFPKLKKTKDDEPIELMQPILRSQTWSYSIYM